MTSAKGLRERAMSDPASVANESDQIRRHLSSRSYDSRRHATVAARKAAHARPRKMVNCISELSDIASTGQSTSIRREACYTLGYIGRVNQQAVDELAELQRSADPEGRELAATARNKLANKSALLC